MKYIRYNQGKKIIHYRRNGLSYLNIEHLKVQAINPDVSTNTRRLATAKLKTLKACDYKCIKCNSRRYLTIDHVNDDANGKRNPSSYKNKECVTLCVDCHNRKTYGIFMWKKKVWDIRCKIRRLYNRTKWKTKAYFAK